MISAIGLRLLKTSSEKLAVEWEIQIRTQRPEFIYTVTFKLVWTNPDKSQGIKHE